MRAIFPRGHSPSSRRTGATRNSLRTVSYRKPYPHTVPLWVISKPDRSTLWLISYVLRGFVGTTWDCLTYSEGEILAESEGFEPSIRCRIHTFQACAFDHSATSPAGSSMLTKAC